MLTPCQDFSVGCISRAHAQLNLSNNGHIYITDLGSRHGTSIITDHEDKISILPFSPTQLLHGDTIVLGRALSSKEGNVAPLDLKVTFQAPEFGISRAVGGRKTMGPVNKGWYDKNCASELETLDATGVMGRFRQATAGNPAPQAAQIAIGVPNPSLSSIVIEDSDDEFYTAAIQATQAAEASASAEEAQMVDSESEREQSIDSDRSVRYGVPPSVLYLSEVEEDLPRSRPGESATPPVIHVNYLRGHEPATQVKAETSVEVIQVDDESDDEAPAPAVPVLPLVSDVDVQSHISVDYDIQPLSSFKSDPDFARMIFRTTPPRAAQLPDSPPRSGLRLFQSPSPPLGMEDDLEDLDSRNYDSLYPRLESDHDHDSVRADDDRDRDSNYGRFYSYSSSAGDDYFEQLDRGNDDVGLDHVSHIGECDDESVGDVADDNGTGAADSLVPDVNEGLTGKSLFVGQVEHFVETVNEASLHVDLVSSAASSLNLSSSVEVATAPSPIASPERSAPIGLDEILYGTPASTTSNKPFDPVEVARGVVKIQRQIDNPTPAEEQAMTEFMYRVNNPTPREEEAMADMMHQVLNPTPEQDAGMVEIMRQIHDPTPQEEQAMTEYMDQVRQVGEVLDAWAAGSGPELLQGEKEEADEEDEEDEEEPEQDEDGSQQDDDDDGQDEQSVQASAGTSEDQEEEEDPVETISDHEPESEDEVVDSGASEIGSQVAIDSTTSSMEEVSEADDDDDEVVEEGDDENMEEDDRNEEHAEEGAADELEQDEQHSDDEAPEEEPIRSLPPMASPAISPFAPPAGYQFIHEPMGVSMFRPAPENVRTW